MKNSGQHSLFTVSLGKVDVTVPSEFPDEYGVCVVVGDPSENPIVRIHSRCFYGEVLGSKHCDCGQQLEASLKLMLVEGGGYLFYLEQEGRGAGVRFKAKTYHAAENSGIGTFDFFEKEFGKHDLRDYRPVANHLVKLGIDQIRLITNNPEKEEAMVQSGVSCTRLKIEIDPVFKEAEEYLLAKKMRGHLL